ncbi:MAG: hypothetical protein ACI4NM_10240 [Bullifex sp.]
MRRLAALIFTCLISLSLMAAYGTDRDIGLVCDIEKGSAEERAVSFFTKEYSLENLEEHVVPELLSPFTRQYGTYLSGILPLENILLSRGDGFLKIKDTTKGVLIDVFYDGEGLITSIGIR